MFLGHSRTFMFLLEGGFPTLTLLAFGPDDSLLPGATLCYIGSLAASLTSANMMLVAPPHPSSDNHVPRGQGGSLHVSCFKKCGLDLGFSYLQWDWALRVLSPVGRAGGGAQVWGILKDQEAVVAWSDHAHNPTPSPQCPQGCPSHRRGHGDSAGRRPPSVRSGDNVSQGNHSCSGPAQQTARGALWLLSGTSFFLCLFLCWGPAGGVGGPGF